MVPFPSEYSTYASSVGVSGPQAPFGAPAPAEPTHATHGSSHFNDILQNLTTPANRSGAASARVADANATKHAAESAAGAGAPPHNTVGVPDHDATPAPAGSVAGTKRVGRGGASGTNDDAPAKAATKSSTDVTAASTPSATPTLVTPPMTVLTPRPRSAWSNASNATLDQNPRQEQDAISPPPNVAAAVSAAEASTISARVQTPAPGQAANANSKSPQTQPLSARAVANAAAAVAAASTPAAKSGAATSKSTTPPPASSDSGEPSVSAPILAAMAGVPPVLPQPSPLPAPIKGASASQAVDDSGVVSAIDATPVKPLAQTRSAFANRGQLGQATTLPQTAGAPSFDADDATESATAAGTTPAAESVLASTLRLAATSTAAEAAHANAPAAAQPDAAPPAQVPPPAVNAALAANAAATSTAAARTSTSTPFAAGSAPAPAAPRPAATVAVPDLVSSAGLNRAVAPVQIETPASLPADVDASAVVSQIVQAMRVQLVQGGGTAQVTLQPGFLGGVTLNVKVDQDGVSASVVADTPAVREALRTQEPALRDALTDQGLRLDHFDVSAPGETPRRNPGGGNGSPAHDQRQPRQQKRRDPSEPAFEFVA